MAIEGGEINNFNTSFKTNYQLKLGFCREEQDDEGT